MGAGIGAGCLSSTRYASYSGDTRSGMAIMSRLSPCGSDLWLRVERKSDITFGDRWDIETYRVGKGTA